MKEYLKVDPWCIIEEGFDPENVKASESIFSLGNGKMGQRANFEEQYSGASLMGNYFAGIFYPDKTKVGWWKVGYPEYFGKMINSINWIGINIQIENETLDLANTKVTQFKRTLNMREGSLSRSFIAELPSGKKLQVQATRFISMSETKIAAISFSIIPLNFKGSMVITPYLDGDVKNNDSNYDEKFWDEVSKGSKNGISVLQIKTKKLDFHVCSGMKLQFIKGKENFKLSPETIVNDKYIAEKYSLSITQDEPLTIIKYICNMTSLDGEQGKLITEVRASLSKIEMKGFDQLFDEHKKVWESKWERSDIIIEGDDRAQQGIRFNIFQLNQTYTGDDERLNIGPKGFTGEKYGGGTYWDTEAFCFPFYLNTADQRVARNLLFYRYRQLNKAIENGLKLGYKSGAALYPMVTINGEECHNEWEITFEEIHRNGAIAYAIYNYLKHTDDTDYLVQAGLEVLIALSRFWSQRATYSKIKQKYVILGVTGPNEYENNVNNNWYTNYIASWTLKYTIQSNELVKSKYSADYQSLIKKLKFNPDNEISKWQEITDKMFFPVIEGTNIFLQQEGYMDKEQLTVIDIPVEERPINQNWSWDRILRSVFIKQADVLQGLYFFIHEFSTEIVRDNFNFYEPKTVHESSLSPCIHSVIAAHIGEMGKAYELYLRTSRLDLDDYNNEVGEGLHITSMAGTWLAIVEGFARKRIIDGLLSFDPLIPQQWNNYTFKILYRGHMMEIIVLKDEIKIWNHNNDKIQILLHGSPFTIGPNSMLRYQKTKN
jgi:maltose phosphorylase